MNDKTIKEHAETMSKLVGRDPVATYLVVDFDGFVGTVGPADENTSTDIEAAKALVSTMGEEDLLTIRNEINALLEEYHNDPST